MADSDSLKPYKPKVYPVIPGGEARYLAGELLKIDTSVTKLIEVVKKLEARIAALGG